ncbi:hypothetical protein NQ314_010438 [Rhamnusium bicolor]|uniref:Peptidase S1 domain-containing protein n=1 Tax=Rhamnusium bicolor TaxID=1586634 RepID=A0AAV8XTS9_9CUCU|nr:hypothetical protein NQ314_010438 [Rhamnusium bicolor]
MKKETGLARSGAGISPATSTEKLEKSKKAVHNKSAVKGDRDTNGKISASDRDTNNLSKVQIYNKNDKDHKFVQDLNKGDRDTIYNLKKGERDTKLDNKRDKDSINLLPVNKVNIKSIQIKKLKDKKWRNIKPRIDIGVSKTLTNIKTDSQKSIKIPTIKVEGEESVTRMDKTRKEFEELQQSNPTERNSELMKKFVSAYTETPQSKMNVNEEQLDLPANPNIEIESLEKQKEKLDQLQKTEEEIIKLFRTGEITLQENIIKIGNQKINIKNIMTSRNTHEQMEISDSPIKYDIVEFFLRQGYRVDLSIVDKYDDTTAMIARTSNDYEMNSPIAGAERSPLFLDEFTAPFSNPHTVAIIKDFNLNKRCGGALVSKQFVLTAAQCVDGHSVEVILGAYDVSKYEKQQVRLRIAEKDITIHPLYESSSLSNDIALLKLPEELTTNDYIQPIDVANCESDLFIGECAILTGWRKSILGYSDKLSHDELIVITNEECQRDSGSPLIARGPRDVLIGIVSTNAKLCLPLPTVFIRISSYQSWIESTMNLTYEEKYTETYQPYVQTDEDKEKTTEKLNGDYTTEEELEGENEE